MLNGSPPETSNSSNATQCPSHHLALGIHPITCWSMSTSTGMGLVAAVRKSTIPGRHHPEVAPRGVRSRPCASITLGPIIAAGSLYLKFRAATQCNQDQPGDVIFNHLNQQVLRRIHRHKITSAHLSRLTTVNRYRLYYSARRAEQDLAVRRRRFDRFLRGPENYFPSPAAQCSTTTIGRLD